MKRTKITENYIKTSHKRHGVVLIIVLVMLVVLSTLGYTITARVTSEKHRDNYIVDYSRAQYACDSAVKYALATMEDINSPSLVERANVPDFSDLFALSEKQYRDFLEQWANEMSKKEFKNKVKQSGSEYAPDTSDINDVGDANTMTTSEVTDVNSVTGNGQAVDYNDPNQLEVPGPYGPKWPLITEPVEFEIGKAKVEITIEDENAKYPVGWTLLEQDSKGENVEMEAEAGFETFCEWMDVNEIEIARLKEQLGKIDEIKDFSMKFKPIKIEDSTIEEDKARSSFRTVEQENPGTTEKKSNKVRSARAALKRLMKRRKREKKRKKEEESEEGRVTEEMHLVDFCRIFNSRLLDSEVLTRPTIVSENRKETPMKYLGMWATRKVNINTAPRHILEAAFNFGGDYVQIADRVIMERRTKPFESIGDLKQRLFRYSDSIEKCEEFITTESGIFTIRVKATSGTATARAMIAVRKNKGKIEKIAAFSE